MSFSQRQCEAWSSPPIDDIGYLSSKELLTKSDEELIRLTETMYLTRYSGWRNSTGNWRKLLGIDAKIGRVLDFGCGSGIESLQLAKAGNQVGIADISDDNVNLAKRIFNLYGFEPIKVHRITFEPPYIDDFIYDAINMSGVLHHIPWARKIIERAHDLLSPDGLLRLMVYSDVGWRIATGTEPPDEVTEHESFNQFVRFFDSVGEYADWYNKEKIITRFGDKFDIQDCRYETPDCRYLVAVLRRK